MARTRRNSSGFAETAMILALVGTVFLIVYWSPSERRSRARYEITGVIENVEIHSPSLGIKRTVVHFKDGRVKTFDNISGAVMRKGKKNKITFNGNDRIIHVSTVKRSFSR